MKKTLLLVLLSSISATISQATISLRNRATLAVLQPSPTLHSLPTDVGIGSIPPVEFEIYNPSIQPPPPNCITFFVSTIQTMYFANNYLNYGITNAFSIPYVVSPRLSINDSLPRLQFNVGMNPNLSAGTYVDTLVILGTRQNVCGTGFSGFSARYLFTVTSTLITGIEFIDLKYGEVSLFPNPASSLLNINNLPSTSNLKFYAITGELVKEVNPEDELITIDISAFENGCYFILFSDRNKIYRREKLVVSK